MVSLHVSILHVWICRLSTKVVVLLFLTICQAVCAECLSLLFGPLAHDRLLATHVTSSWIKTACPLSSTRIITIIALSVLIKIPELLRTIQKLRSFARIIYDEIVNIVIVYDISDISLRRLF